MVVGPLGYLLGGLLGTIGWAPFSALAALDDLASTLARRCRPGPALLEIYAAPIRWLAVPCWEGRSHKPRFPWVSVSGAS